MALKIPTTQELKDLFLTNYENSLNQSVPLAAKAFLRVCAAIDALLGTALFRFAAERVLQNLALTATDEDLDRIGENYGVYRRPAEATNLTIESDADPGAFLPQSVDWVGDPNNERYKADSSASEAGGLVTLDITARSTGPAGNLEVSDTLTIGTQTPGISNVGTVTVINQLGVEKESNESYRRRILTEIRTVGGGGNSADYRTWTEQTAGVENGFPYSGKPRQYFVSGTDISFASADNSINSTGTDFTDAKFAIGHAVNVSGSGSNDGIFTINSIAANKLTIAATVTNESAGAVITCENESLPGDRTVFVEAVSSIDPDGIAPPALLASVRSNINTDPDTGRRRPPLGETDETLFVESIERTTFYTEVRSLNVDPAIQTQVENDIETAIDEYYRSTREFITGLDFEADKNNTITDLTVAAVVQDILEPVGGSAGSVGFGLVVGVFIPTYVLKQGEMAKSGGVTFI